MRKFTKEAVKEAIKDHEYNANGFNHLCGVGIKVLNLKVKKDMAVADVVLITDQETGNQERYNSCEYPLNKLVEAGLLK